LGMGDCEDDDKASARDASSRGGFRSIPYLPSFAVEDEKDPLWDFGLYDAWDLGTLSMNDAAERMGVSISILKFRCRELGVARWPGRRLQGIVSCYEYVASLVSNTINTFLSSSTYLLSKGDEFWSELEMNVNILNLQIKELKCNLQTLKEYASQLEEEFLRTGSIDVIGVPKDIESIRGRVYKHRYVISKFTSHLSCGDRRVT